MRKVLPLGVLLVALVFGGCTAESSPAPPRPDPNTAVDVAPTPTPSPEGTSGAPVPPAEAPSPTVESAEQTATYFLRLYPYAYVSGDLSDWDRLASPNCQYCARTRDDVRRIQSSAHRVTGGEVEVTTTRSDEVTPGEMFSVLVDYDEAPSEEVDAEGAVVAASDGGRYTALFALRWSEQAWVVEAVDINKAS